MSRLFILIALIGGSIAWYKYRKLPPEDRKKWLKKSLIITGLLFFAYLVITGRLSIVFALLAALIPFIRKTLSLANYWPFIQKLWQHKSVLTPSARGQQQPQGKQSTVRTHLLVMTLNHVSGDIDGDVLVGQYQGKRLSELTIEQLAELYSHCPANEQDTRQLLDTYLSKMRSSEWQSYQEQHQQSQSHSQSHRSGNNEPMTVTEAAEVLGVKETATKQEIIDAHRRLMTKLHPDKGGTSYLAIQVNAAKDVMLAQLKT
ncbi:DnaJ domain-containing protein [Endozoicomonas sp. SM1973]|uniref:DnaJ domain-containing protein n=1 Tax=Spartinivicinus marinus TaxID=2994442 RepID=A0A853HVW5_9GAMM|nr:DnaJ domain-containing protein [Spartinivicinus marinus]MCX4029013.1 DnaJ domain-containing protein [Spartinivicinus marinus]NYZ65403.1 DnaJ domain-containing protein [Spartinivicinus marinus]